MNRRRRRAKTPADREAELMLLAEDLAETQLREGTASAQVLTHFLKLSSSRERLEQARLEGEIYLGKIRAEREESAKRSEHLFEEALSAMRSYTGQEVQEYDDSE